MKKINLLALLTSILLINGCATTKISPTREVDLRELPCHWYENNPTSKYSQGLQRARLFANYVAIYSVAASNVYDRAASDEEPIPFSSDEQWVEVKHEKAIQNKIGFAARSWKRIQSNGEVELVITFRGTDDFTKDFFKGNFVFAKGVFGKTQFEAALDYAKDIRNLVKGDAKITRTVLVGHSLGGGLAEYVQRFLPDSEAITFDTSPNQGRLYSLFQKKEVKVAVRVYERGEVLAYMRYILSPDLSFENTPAGVGTKAIWFDFYSDGPLDGHSIRDLSISLLKVSASTGNKPSINILKQLIKNRGKLVESKCTGHAMTVWYSSE